MKRPAPPRIELGIAALGAILDRTKTGALSAAEHATLQAAIDTLAWLTRELESQGTSLERLRRMLFGARTEKTREVLGDTGGRGRDQRPREGDGRARHTDHGRNGAAAYAGAARVTVPHAALGHGDHCPGCEKGKVYVQAEPAVVVRVAGNPSAQVSRITRPFARRPR